MQVRLSILWKAQFHLKLNTNFLTVSLTWQTLCSQRWLLFDWKEKTWACITEQNNEIKSFEYRCLILLTQFEQNKITKTDLCKHCDTITHDQVGYVNISQKYNNNNLADNGQERWVICSCATWYFHNFLV